MVPPPDALQDRVAVADAEPPEPQPLGGGEGCSLHPDTKSFKPPMSWWGLVVSWVQWGAQRRVLGLILSGWRCCWGLLWRAIQ